MALQYQHKQASDYDFFLQSQADKIKALKEKLISEAESKVVAHFTKKYGSTSLYRVSKPKLTLRQGAQGQPVFDGIITVYTQISAGLAARKLDTNVHIVHSTASLPKYKLLDKIVSDTKTEGEIKAALVEAPIQNVMDVKVDLSAFRIVDSGEKVLDVFHPIYGESILGKISREELGRTNKAALFDKGFKGTFAKTHSQKVLAGKEFEVNDCDGDMVLITVGKAQGWLNTKDIIQEPLATAEAKADFQVGDRVLITSAFDNYYGDFVDHNDLRNKEATVARFANEDNTDFIILTADNVGEEIWVVASGPTSQKSALHSLAGKPTEKVVVRLESLLRDMVLDRFNDGTPIKFTGKFKAPEIKSSVQPTQEVAQIAEPKIEENTMSDSAIKFTQASGFHQYMESQLQKMSNLKRSLSEKATSELISYLNRSYGPVRVIASHPVLDYELDKGYSGKVAVQAEIMDKTGIKRIALDIIFSADNYKLPTDADITKAISAVVSEQEKFSQVVDAEIKAKLDQIDAEEKHKALQTEVALETPVVAPALKKEAAGSIQPQESQIQPVFKINRAFLPQSLQVGQSIDLDGVRYRLVSKHDGTQLDKSADSGSLWTFEREWLDSNDAASYRITNY
jgi:hypothetical protein